MPQLSNRYVNDVEYDLIADLGYQFVFKISYFILVNWSFIVDN